MKMSKSFGLICQFFFPLIKKFFLNNFFRQVHPKIGRNGLHVQEPATVALVLVRNVPKENQEGNHEKTVLH